MEGAEGREGEEGEAEGLEGEPRLNALRSRNGQILSTSTWNFFSPAYVLPESDDDDRGGEVTTLLYKNLLIRD